MGGRPDCDEGTMKRVIVGLGDGREYEVLVGAGAIQSLREVIPQSAKRVAVVTQKAVGLDVDPGLPNVVLTIPPGEDAKSLATVEELCRGFARAQMARGDAVIAVGGGVTTDVAGLAAALYHRGIPFVNIPTTLLGQVDAAIGGKTGVNLPEGKNLVGAFWQPSAVICDTNTLTTLGERELASGRGEMAKYAFLGDIPPGTTLLDQPIDEQVAWCVELKARVVSEDEREDGGRALLNYGHTLAHALEAAAFAPERKEKPWDMTHGEAVAVGLVFAAMLAKRVRRIDEERVELHREVVSGFGLSYAMPQGASAAELVSLMGRDKKAHGDLTFVLDGPRGVELIRGVEPKDVTDTLIEMGAQP
jgi:5-deoxy-5-amino-3-dehydroquinate synthase